MSIKHMLLEKDGVMPQSPNETRCNSHCDCVKSFVTNDHRYREIAIEHAQDFDPNKELHVVPNILNQLHKETCISETVEICLDQLSSDVLEPYRHHFKKIFQQAI
ncbi:hypothetical protein PR048_009326 [Dryococelus australis]|uniref:Uncharacterized protein n=1 Tax=Dryococelus australis TaxID=614101 RepID=A0ABQ9HZY4_9NEOP|nr:hypothetical protein PR048_009326 [Dryococelus australis]